MALTNPVQTGTPAPTKEEAVTATVAQDEAASALQAEAALYMDVETAATKIQVSVRDMCLNPVKIDFNYSANALHAEHFTPTPFRLVLRSDVNLVRDARIIEVQESEDMIMVGIEDKDPNATETLGILQGCVVKHFYRLAPESPRGSNGGLWSGMRGQFGISCGRLLSLTVLLHVRASPQMVDTK